MHPPHLIPFSQNKCLKPAPWPELTRPFQGLAKFLLSKQVNHLLYRLNLFFIYHQNRIGHSDNNQIIESNSSNNLLRIIRPDETRVAIDLAGFANQ